MVSEGCELLLKAATKTPPSQSVKAVVAPLMVKSPLATTDVALTCTLPENVRVFSCR